jgi:hypothetical protein
MYAAAGNDLIESPVRIQEEVPTMKAAKALYDKRLAAIMKNGDANDTLYELESIYNYSLEADLPKIKAHVMLINNGEDFADPPTLGTVERAFKRIAHGTGGIRFRSLLQLQNPLEPRPRKLPQNDRQPSGRPVRRVRLPSPSGRH